MSEEKQELDLTDKKEFLGDKTFKTTWYTKENGEITRHTNVVHYVMSDRINGPQLIKEELISETHTVIGHYDV